MTDAARVQLPDDCDMMASEAIKQDIITAFAVSPSLELDASRVARISTATFQVVIAAASKAKAEGGTLHVCEPSEVFQKSAKTLGLDEFMIGHINV